MSGIYMDEHEKYQIDLRKTIWSTDELHTLYKDTMGNALSDVDWIGETETEILLIEFKNLTFVHSNILCRCRGCTCAACTEETGLCLGCGKQITKKAIKRNKYLEFIEKTCKKYYGTAFYLHVVGKIKPVKYYCIVSNPLAGKADKILYKRATTAIRKRLPFKLQERLKIAVPLIEDYKILSIPEWNAYFPMFPLEESTSQLLA